MSASTMTLTRRFSPQASLAAPGAVVRPAAWDPKALPPVSDALALVRRERWARTALCLSALDPDMQELPCAFLEGLTDALCYAA